jgi:hypothetical protein
MTESILDGAVGHPPAPVFENVTRGRGHDAEMPRIDDGPTDGPPGNELRTAWVELSADEARELLESLKLWAEGIEEGHPDPGWHTHVTDDAGRELTVSIRLGETDPSVRS